jgi:acyl-CoA hydrolase
MDWKKDYQSKLVSVQEAAAKVESGDRIFFGPCSAAPIQLMEALAARVNELKDVHVVTGLTLHPFEFLKSPEYIGRINYHTLFYGPYERAFFKVGNVTVNSVNFSKAHWALKNYYKVNTLMADVSAPDEEGYLYYGPMGVALNGTAESIAKKIIVQVNKHQPRVKGVEHRIHVKDVHYICELDHQLPALPQDPPTEIDEKIASFIVPQIPDGATIQLGVGSLANAIGYKLEHKKNLSVHTEMFTDSMMELAKKGVITGKMVASFGLGSNELYEFVGQGRVELKPLRLVVDPFEIGKCDKLMSVNVTLMVDLTGQACSESIGFFQYSSTGGQSDFARGVSLSNGGKGFCCLPSTVKTKDGKVQSTISTALPPGAVVTTQRSDVMNIVTEYGIADLFCKPIPDRVKAMISIAHPDFREGLTKQAVEAGLIRKH